MPSPSSHRASIRVEVTPTGTRLVKEVGPAGAARLDREARLLADAQHPGVVELLDGGAGGGDRGDGGVRLVTTFVGSHTLDTWRPADAAQVAGLLAALTDTVADLHLVGLAHGRLTPDHVLVDRDGRPRLCGFAEATRVDAGAPSARHDDVAAIGALLDQVLDHLDTGPRRRRRDRRAVRALRAVAAEAQHPSGPNRPSARRLAGAILGAVPHAYLVPVPRAVAPDAHLDLTAEPEAAPAPAPEPEPEPEPPPAVGADTIRPPRPRTDPPRAPRRSRRHPPRRGATVATALVGVALLGLGISTFGHSEAPTLASDTMPVASGTDGSTVAPPEPPPAEPAPPATGAAASPLPSPPADTAAPVPNRCEDPGPCTIVSLDGTVVRNGVAYAIGEPGDEIGLGDFTCRGTPAPVVLRPGTGAIFAFEAWAANGHETTAMLTAQTDAGAHLLPSPVDTTGCSSLLVALPSGTVATVALPPPARP